MKTKVSDQNLEKEKLEIIKWVATLKNETSIARLKMLKESKVGADWWNEVSEEEKNTIDKGLADIKAGRVKPHKEVENFTRSGF